MNSFTTTDREIIKNKNKIMVEAQCVGTIGILRECKNKWERRCSLTPSEVVQIVAKGIRVLV